jgi:hypothetical protein
VLQNGTAFIFLFWNSLYYCSAGVVHILEDTAPFPPGEISADISWGEKYEKGEEINEENVKEKAEKT